MILGGVLELTFELGNGIWPSLLLASVMFLWAAFFCWFAFTGRTWSDSYDRKILGKDKELNDR